MESDFSLKNGTVKNLTEKKMFVYVALAIMLLAGFIIKLPLLNYNIPLCANVDERANLTVLLRFENEGFNPKFFFYPTLYFYFIFFLLKLFWINIHNIIPLLYWGRFINLLIGCALSIPVFILAKHCFKKSLPALLAVFFTLFSHILTFNVFYISVDLLTTFFCVYSLVYLSKFFDHRKPKDWLSAIILMGFTVSTKYTGIILFVTYVIFEWLYPSPLTKAENTSRLKSSFIDLLNKSFRLPFIICCFLITIIILAVYFFFPFGSLMHIVRDNQSMHSTVDAQDMLLLKLLKDKLLLLAMGSLSLSVLATINKKLGDRISVLRIYAPISIILSIFIATSPYILKSWGKAAYELGTMWKFFITRDAGPQWLAYIKFYLNDESKVLLVFFMIGLFYMIRQRRKTSAGIWLLCLYLTISYVSISSAKNGFIRYLSLLLPVFYCISSWGIYRLYLSLYRYRVVFARVFSFSIALFMIICIFHTSKSVQDTSMQKDALYSAYEHILSIRPSKILYGGTTPNLEFQMQKIAIEEIPLKALAEENPGFLQRLDSNTIFLLDTSRNDAIGEGLRKKLKLQWSNNASPGQYIYIYNPPQQ